MSLRYRRRVILLALLAVALQGGLSAYPNTAHASPQGANQKAKLQTPNSAVRWGFYITYNPNSWVSLQANASHLNYVSPWFYNLAAGGQITGKDRPEVSALLR